MDSQPNSYSNSTMTATPAAGQQPHPHQQSPQPYAPPPQGNNTTNPRISNATSTTTPSPTTDLSMMFPTRTMFQHPALVGMSALLGNRGNGVSNAPAPSSGAAAAAATALQMQSGITANVMELAAANGYMDSMTADLLLKSVPGASGLDGLLLNPNAVSSTPTTDSKKTKEEATPRSRAGSKRKRAKIASAAPPSDGNPETMKLGGVPVPVLSPNSSTAMQVQAAAAVAAAKAAPLKGQGKRQKQEKDEEGALKNLLDGDSVGGDSDVNEDGKELTAEEKAQLKRNRNREHARSTRLRKKAYVNKLKELVEGLHAERTEEVRKRRVAIQHLAEIQNVRRSVVRTFLGFHINFESDARKWSTLLEDGFWLKQPVTPYRSFRRTEIEKECRVSRGIEAVIADAASMSVMVEGVGSRNARWMELKREDFLLRLEAKNQGRMPSNIMRQNSQLQHAVSSLSSSSGSSNASCGEEEKAQQHLRRLVSRSIRGALPNPAANNATPANTPQPLPTSKVSSGSSHDSRRNLNTTQPPAQTSNDFHDYNAPSLPDPIPDSSGSDSPTGTSAIICTDSSSSAEEDAKHHSSSPTRIKNKNSSCSSSGSQPTQQQTKPVKLSGLPCNIAPIAPNSGIRHNIQSLVPPKTNNTKQSPNKRLNLAPPTPLPPFVGIGKDQRPNPNDTSNQLVVAKATVLKKDPPMATPPNTATTPASQPKNTTPATDDNTTNSSSYNSTTNTLPQIKAYYHLNEDDMLLTEDTLMCPFTFRSQDAVKCGAYAECVMPGMLRAQFSSRNKLLSLEMVYDSMGFMQQLERASGSEGMAQIVPNSLEMALSPNSHEARVITLAKPPYLIISVNEVWTKLTKYTQMEVEGKELSILHGKKTDMEAGTTLLRNGKPVHDFSEVSKGRCASSANFHYDKDGKDFVAYVCSYPLTNADDDITHILHIYKELPVPVTPETDY